MVGLVSIITPCYNGALYISRLLNSVLEQTYPSIEMIVVDDGSTDDSKNIVQSYITKFSNKNFTLKYIYQENQGQSAAVNNALKYIEGEYLAWPDCDDFYATPTSISSLVDVLENSSKSVSMVRCFCQIFDERDFSLIGTYPCKSEVTQSVDLFEDCLFDKNGYWFVPGGYLAKVGLLKSVIPNLIIYTEKDAGQNWQLMLPLLYGNECITINDYLYSIVARAASHSRGQYSTFSRVISKFDAYERTIISTLSTMNMDDARKNEYIHAVNKKYRLVRLNTCFEFIEKKKAWEIYHEMRKCQDVVSLINMMKLYLMFTPNIYRFVLLFKGFISRILLS